MTFQLIPTDPAERKKWLFAAQAFARAQSVRGKWVETQLALIETVRDQDAELLALRQKVAELEEALREIRPHDLHHANLCPAMHGGICVCDPGVLRDKVDAALAGGKETK